ncbi:7737_t:CDS:10 [Ambispora gerdemannii]|uniref:7737_t:CDS:1 n=1 Tax=Ambispora gerdemannii TaxID=144530 RepID=A0A9N9FGB3_9GLOM|nr:7737_t:CDS:10 [Ambispora gerdemannii]
MFKKKKPAKKEKLILPNDLHELGYKLDENEKLVTLDGQPYVFEKSDRQYNEALYDVIIETLGGYVREALQSRCGLIKTILPIGMTENDIHTHIFLSPDYLTNENMCIFIPGTFHASGLWSRRMLTEKSINDGGMVTYTKRARSLGCSVLITNPNEIYWYKGKAVVTLPKATVPFDPIPENESPEAHLEYVFKHFIKPSAAKKIFIIANSYGGYCAVDLLQKKFDELRHRVRAIEFAATTHSIDYVRKDSIKIWIREHCRNWVVADEPLLTEIIDPRFGCVNYSSGCQLYEFVLDAIIDQVFELISRKLQSDDEICAINDDLDDSEALQREAEQIFGSSKIVQMPNGVHILPSGGNPAMEENGIAPEDLDPNWL